jgi:methyl-accepting chemotaxis protein
VIGAVLLGIPAPKCALFDMIAEIKIANDGFIYIFNSQCHMILHPTLRGKNVRDYRDETTGREYYYDMIKTLNGSTIYREKDEKGIVRKIVAHYIYFEKWDWIIVSCAPRDDILHGLNVIFYIMLGLLAIFSFGLVITSNFISIRLTKPFKVIIDTAVKVSNGDLKVFIPQPHYVKCAEIKNCGRTDCPSYATNNKACWRIKGTFDDQGKIIPGVEEKASRCVNCVVYKKSVRDEIDELIEAINNMIVTIRRIMSDINVITTELGTDSENLADISKKMDMESQNQAGSIEQTTAANEELMGSIENVASSAAHQVERVTQTSAAMEELASSTKIVGDNSVNSSRKANETVIEAKNTEKVLQDTTVSINQISESSKKIVDIVGIINDISDQINLLSLNAAIEAARAGEHGKGFAVVSQEISKLADATAQSTKEIESLIKTSRADIEKGAKLVNHTMGAITSMITKIEEAAQLIEEIAASSEEQIKGSETVMLDVEEINKMSEKIAMATSEQKLTSTEMLNAITLINDSIQVIASSAHILADAAESIRQKASRLKEVNNEFKV